MPITTVRYQLFLRFRADRSSDHIHWIIWKTTKTVKMVLHVPYWHNRADFAIFIEPSPWDLIEFG